MFLPWRRYRGASQLLRWMGWFRKCQSEKTAICGKMDGANRSPGFNLRFPANTQKHPGEAGGSPGCSRFVSDTMHAGFRSIAQLGHDACLWLGKCTRGHLLGWCNGLEGTSHFSCRGFHRSFHPAEESPATRLHQRGLC